MKKIGKRRAALLCLVLLTAAGVSCAPRGRDTGYAIHGSTVHINGTDWSWAGGLDLDGGPVRALDYGDGALYAEVDADVDFTLSASVYLDESTAALTLWLGQNAETGAGYTLEISGTRTWLRFSYTDENGKTDRLGSKTIQIEGEQTYLLRAARRGGTMQIGFEDVRTIQGEPRTAFSVALPYAAVRGRVGFALSAPNYAISNLALQRTPAEKTYTNPLMDNTADPFVLLHDGVYYLYATNASDRGYRVFTSVDMVNWTAGDLAFSKDDADEYGNPYNWGSWGFWAPEVTERNGVFYLCYTAEERLCIATADSPRGPFRQPVYGPLLLGETETGEPTGEIDGHFFRDDDGTEYLYFVRVRDAGGNVIFGVEMHADLLSPKRETVTRLLSAQEPGTRWEAQNVNEGPEMLKHNGVYYLTFSANDYRNKDYGIGYATADTPLGAYTKYAYNPVMSRAGNAVGTGHHSFAQSPDGTELFVVYHCHPDRNGAEPRKLCIDRAAFVPDPNGGQDLFVVYGPTTTPQPVPRSVPVN